MAKQLDIHIDEPDSTDRYTFGNRYHIFNCIGIHPNDNITKVLTVNVIS